MKIDRSTIGISVISGALATKMPSFLLCFSVSVMTNVNKGPGDMPATNPNKTPAIKNGRDSIISDFIVSLCEETRFVQYSLYTGGL